MFKRFNKRFNKGPELPAKLNKELQGSTDGSGDSNAWRSGKRPASRKEKRKAQRQDKKQRRDAFNQRLHLKAPQSGEKRGRMQAELSDRSPAGSKRQRTQQHQKPQQQQQQQQQQHRANSSNPRLALSAKPSAAAQAAPSSRTAAAAGSSKANSSKTRFNELLGPGHAAAAAAAKGGAAAAAAADEAFQADLKLQQQLAKKLKVKKGKKSGPADGLDDLLAGISSGDAAAFDGSDGDDDVIGSEGDDVIGSEGDDVIGSDGDADDVMGSDDDDVSGSDLDIDDGDDDLMGSDEIGSDEGLGGGSDDEGLESDGDDEDLAGGSSDDEGLEDSEHAADSDPELSESEEEEQPAAAAAAAAGKYVPPALRAAAAAAAAGGSALTRRVTGLLNRLAEANIQSIAADVAALYGSEGRRAVCDAACSGIIQAAAEGPRASKQFAAVAATFIAALAALAQAQEVAANFLAALAARLEAAAAAGDGLAQSNLVTVLAYMYSCGAVRCDLVYSFLAALTARFSEADVAMMAVLLAAVGLQLRADDPPAMRQFVVDVHAAAAAAGQSGVLTKRSQLLMELVVDVKNNRRREGRGGAAAVLAPGVLKWLRQCGVQQVCLANLSWQKLLLPDKKGIWWIPAATDAAAGLLPAALGGRQPANGGGAAAAAADDERTAQLLQLAAAQRMNTDVRRAVFLAVMGSEDCVEAFERLVRLPLKGDQEREVVRVVLECALQESSYNPYYTFLAARLSQHIRSHRATLRFAIWDHIKEASAAAASSSSSSSSGDVRRLTNLGRLCGGLIAAGALPLSALKVVEFGAQMPARVLLLVRVLVKEWLGSSKSEESVREVCQKAAAMGKSEKSEERGYVRELGGFLRMSVGPWLVSKEQEIAQQQLDVLLRRLEVAQKLLK